MRNPNKISENLEKVTSRHGLDGPFPKRQLIFNGKSYFEYLKYGMYRLIGNRLSFVIDLPLLPIAISFNHFEQANSQV